MQKTKNILEKLLFVSRWLLVPFLVGLVISAVLLMIKFIEKLSHLIIDIRSLSEIDIVLGVLSMVDLTLIASLIFIIVFSSYESFVSKFDSINYEDKPAWMGKVDFAALKMKVIGSIVAISSIELLKVFINLKNYDEQEIQWKVIIFIAFVISGVLFAVMDRLSSRQNHN
ncbi:MAG: TIGR00645 family protein [Gammaproteobacteria bacterium]|nr:TIGR00645 family protein [Gammaproteobacteria bacterium]